jgi:hypothetical protein
VFAGSLAIRNRPLAIWHLRIAVSVASPTQTVMNDSNCSRRLRNISLRERFDDSHLRRMKGR